MFESLTLAKKYIYFFSFFTVPEESLLFQRRKFRISEAFVSPNLQELRKALICLTKREIEHDGVVRTPQEEALLLPIGNFLMIETTINNNESNDELSQKIAILKSDIQCQIGDGILSFE